MKNIVTLILFVFPFAFANENPGALMLEDCPTSPNCVSTQTEQISKKMAAIEFKVTPEVAIDLVKQVVLTQPRTKLLKEETNQLHFAVKSKLFGFVDDVVFSVDKTKGVIHYRSASRVGYGDLGANRKRMESLREQIVQQLNAKVSGFEN